MLCKKKKWVSALTLIAFFACFAVGCGGDKGSKKNPVSDEPAKSQPENKDAGYQVQEVGDDASDKAATKVALLSYKCAGCGKVEKLAADVTAPFC